MTAGYIIYTCILEVTNCKGKSYELLLRLKN